MLPDHYLAQAVLESKSGESEHDAVMTWVFRNDLGIGGANPESVANSIQRVLDGFYAKPNVASTLLSRFPATLFSRLYYRIYDLGEDVPRTPMYRLVSQTGETYAKTLGSGQALPREVAICLSLRTEDRTRRGFGRIYMGPFISAGVLGAETNTGRPHPLQGIRDIIVAGAEDVLGSSEDVTWVVWSRMDNTGKPVTGGYVDDEFDTIRRRGMEPTVRDSFGTWAAAGPPPEPA